MRRLLLVPAVVLGLLIGTYHPASAASGNAGCIGTTVSFLAGPGFGEYVVAPLAMGGGVGQYVGPAASSNNCSNLP